MIGEAHRRGTPFYADLESHGCPPATHVLGCELPKAIEAGYLGPEFKIFKEPMFNQRALASVPQFIKDTVNYIVFAPLRELTFTPDLLVILTDRTDQAEIILRALSYSTGKVLNSRMTNIMGCAWLYAYPYLSGEVNYLTTGLGFGMKAQKVFPEGRQLFSIPCDWLPTITQNLEEMMWVPPSYVDPSYDEKVMAKFGLLPQ
jgi:uncharacterized protein (DUF169 family)